MPQVPGIPDVIPQVQPYERPVPLPGVEAPPEAFGAGVSRAIQTFGGDVEKASDEVFSRALALRQLQVEGKLRDLTTQYYNEVAPIQADFLAKQGENANTEALTTHNAQLTQVGQKYIGMAGQYGPFGINNFGAEAASMQRSFIREATIHSASETRKALDNSLDADFQSRLDRVRNATDIQTFDNELKNVPNYISDKAAQNGWLPAEVARRTGVATSGLIVARVEGLARQGDYMGARQFYNQYQDKILDLDKGVIQKMLFDVENHRAAGDIARASANGFAPYMTNREIDQTAGVSTPVLDIFKRAQQKLQDQGIQVTIGGQGGVRTPEQQAALVAKGASKTMDSDHLTGRAMDVVLRNPDGTPNYKDSSKVEAINQAMRDSAEELGIPLKPRISWDPDHFGLEKDYDTAQAPRTAPTSLQSRINAGVRYASNQFPDNPYIGEYTQAAIEHQDAVREKSAQDVQRTARNTLLTASLGLGQGQTVATDLNSLFANGGPDAQLAWKNADPALQQSIMDRLARNLKGENIRWTNEGLVRYHQLLEMEDHDPYNFALVNMAEEKNLPNSAIAEMMRRQERAVKGMDKDPGAQEAWKYITAHYSTALSPMTTDDKKEMYGAVKSFVEKYKEMYGHEPRSSEDYENIYNLTKYTGHSPGMAWGQWDYNIWHAMPPATLDKYRENFPGEEDDKLLMRYQKDMAAIRYNELYGPKKGIGHA